MQSQQAFTIRSLRYDLTLKREWTCDLVDRFDNLLVFLGTFEYDVDHSQLGRIAKGTVSYEYYWLDRWYNVFGFHEPDGSFRNFYCNVNTPPALRGEILEYIDLDIDIVVWPDGRTLELDREEFEQNALRFGYPSEVRENAFSAAADLRVLIDSRQFPFDQYL